jgi:hypothetical protein
MSTSGALGLIAVGLVWGVGLEKPEWWPMRDEWWLVGGWTTGASIILSGILALALLVWSYRHHR